MNITDMLEEIQYQESQQEHDEESRRIVATPGVLTADDKAFYAEVCNIRPVTVSNALTAFVRRHCADYDRVENLCIGHRTGTCLIMQGKPCDYFKTAVWPICDPGYIFATEKDKYDTLFPLYKMIDVSLVRTNTDIRRCGCGEVLKYRQRVCPKCLKMRRMLTYRKKRKTG